MKVFHAAACAVCTFLLVGCFFQQEAPDYRDATDLPPLELPPDLSAPSSASQINIPDANTSAAGAATPQQPAVGETSAAAAVTSGATPGAVLPNFRVAQMRRDGRLQWLEVAADPESIWPELETFWSEQGAEVRRNEPRIGVMETEWHDDESLDLPEGVVALPTQSKFRVRLEHAGAATNVFVTHRLARQSGETDDGLPAWVQDDGDSELEAEMLSRLLVFLGDRLKTVAPAQPAAAPAAVGPPSVSLRTLAGVPVLTVGDQLGRTWPRARDALGQAGFALRQADQAKGIFHVKDERNEVDDRGLFSKVFGKGKDALGTYQIHLLGQASQTLITIHKKDDEALDAAVAYRLLTRLRDALE